MLVQQLGSSWMLLRPLWQYQLAVVYGVCLNSMDFQGTKGLSTVYGPVELNSLLLCDSVLRPQQRPSWALRRGSLMHRPVCE